MNKSVEHYISELLFLHDCVIIPNFGGFVGNQKPSQLNNITGVLTPPSKQILFNPNLKNNDGLLIAHIANQEAITQNIAKENVEIFSNESNAKLSDSKVLRLANIGLFTVGKEGELIFSQDSSINYSLDAFGMKPTYNKSAVRKITTEKRLETTVETITSRNPKILLRAAAVIIPLVALSYLSISQQERINNIYIQMATLNPFAPSETIEKTVGSNTDEKLEINVGDARVVEMAEKEISPVIISKKTYYIIAGAFAEKKNANRMLNKLNKWHYSAEILEERNLMRVSYDSFYTKENAILALNKIRKENPEAWLLTK